MLQVTDPCEGSKVEAWPPVPTTVLTNISKEADLSALAAPTRSFTVLMRHVMSGEVRAHRFHAEAEPALVLRENMSTPSSSPGHCERRLPASFEPLSQ